ncbi:hypothetical protein Plhal703r1_c03g0015631 [Plasmopara halstedii]
MELVKPIISDHDLIELTKRMGFILMIYLSQTRSKYFDSMDEAALLSMGSGNTIPINIKYACRLLCPICMLWLYSKQYKRPDVFKNMREMNFSFCT